MTEYPCLVGTDQRIFGGRQLTTVVSFAHVA